MLENENKKKGPTIDEKALRTDGRTYGRTDGRTDPLKEMQSHLKTLWTQRCPIGLVISLNQSILPFFFISERRYPQRVRHHVGDRSLRTPNPNYLR